MADLETTGSCSIDRIQAAFGDCKTRKAIGWAWFPGAAIARYIVKTMGAYSKLLGRIGEAADRLQEYRTALISAAVTGNIDVRKEVA